LRFKVGDKETRGVEGKKNTRAVGVKENEMLGFNVDTDGF
jgi:hypothetical protein